jgi:uncharacterized membrane protein YoaK (UPF0700 family)
MVIRYARDVRLLAAALSAVAGYVDAIGYMMTGGFFVSFMSGNSTRLALGLAEGAGYAALAAGLIASFVAGASTGALVARLTPWGREQTILAVVTALLATSAALTSLGFATVAVFLLALAMGAENTVFAEEGDVRIGLTYMTGTLVKLGKRITAAAMGGDRFGWAPYLGLWLGLAGGAVLGALSYARIGASALWIAAGLMAALTVLAGGLHARRRFAA